jgi:Ca2+-transporting ATPase
MELLRHQVITSVSASVLTGNALLLFDESCNLRLIAVLVEQVVTEYHQQSSLAVTESVDETQRAAQRKLRRLADGTLADSLERVRPESWQAIDQEKVLAILGTSAARGLSPEAVERMRRTYGANVFPEPETRSRLGIFIDQFKSLPVYLLGLAAGLSILTGGLADAAVIAAVVGINAVIGYVTESRAEQIIQALRHLVRPSAVVLRESLLVEVSAQQVVVGDILVLRPGAYIAADARIIEAAHLTIDESILTGESMPVIKTCEPIEGANVALADRFNMVFAGTLVTGGQGLGIVVATGIHTEIGAIQALVLESESPETPIERQLDTVGNQLVLLSIAVCGLVFFMGLLRGNGFLQMLRTSISLAVAAVPEGLPAVATTTMALGVENMRRHKVLIRNLSAVCTMGALQTICFDKTGTVTLNQMSVLRLSLGTRRITVSEGYLLSADGTVDPRSTEEARKLIEVCVLCNESEVTSNNGSYVIHGTATENALIHLALGTGADVQELRARYPRIQTEYRSDDRQFMTTLHKAPEGDTLVCLKGSPLEVLAKCGSFIIDGVTIPLAEDARELIEEENASMSGDALRILGVGFARRNGDRTQVDGNGFTWLGLVGMADPIRAGVKESIKVFHQAGLETVMITGDQSLTAEAVGRALSLSPGRPLKVLDSSHLTNTDPEVLRALCNKAQVFSRVSPSHKLQIVRALQSDGKVVAMTGDGINDGPALKAADVGVAMGQGGTDVARQVADVVLEEDNLETLTIAISDGRTIYRNIRKTLHYLLATNFSEIEVMFLAGALGLGSPLNAMQLLWINLISDIFPGLSLALDPPEPDVMESPPRDPEEPIVKAEDFRRLAFESSLMTGSCLAAYGYGIARYGMGAHAATLAFQSLTSAQIVHALTCRSETRSIFDNEYRAPNNFLNIAVVTSLGMQLAAQFFPPLRTLLGLTPLTAMDGLVAGASALFPLLVCEATKKPKQGNRA